MSWKVYLGLIKVLYLGQCSGLDAWAQDFMTPPTIIWAKKKSFIRLAPASFFLQFSRLDESFGAWSRTLDVGRSRTGDSRRRGAKSTAQLDHSDVDVERLFSDVIVGRRRRQRRRRQETTFQRKGEKVSDEEDFGQVEVFDEFEKTGRSVPEVNSMVVGGRDVREYRVRI